MTAPISLTQAQQALADLRPLSPGEVALLLRVNPKTVTRWARTGKLKAFKTLGGHRRFAPEPIAALLAELGEGS